MNTTCDSATLETQAILVRLRSDLVDIFEAVARGGLGRVPVEWTVQSSACVVLAARGYPARPETGARIEGLERAAEHQGAHIFHAGTARSQEGEWLTAGGRVLGITATGKTLDRALQRCYDTVGRDSLGRHALPAVTSRIHRRTNSPQMNTDGPDQRFEIQFEI